MFNLLFLMDDKFAFFVQKIMLTGTTMDPPYFHRGSIGTTVIIIIIKFLRDSN